jgi:hypothetical protein
MLKCEIDEGTLKKKDRYLLIRHPSNPTKLYFLLRESEVFLPTL